MRKIRLIVHTGFAGADHVDEIEVDDDTPDDDLWEMAQDYLNNCGIEAFWEEVEPE